MVGAATCSALASAPSVVGPPKTMMDSAEARAGVSPIASSWRRSRRRRWMAAEWIRSATASAPLAARSTRLLTVDTCMC